MWLLRMLQVQFEVHPYVYSYLYYKWLIDYKISEMLNKNSLVLLKKGVAKQSRINSLVWHLKWFIRTRADIKLRPIGLAKSYKD